MSINLNVGETFQFNPNTLNSIPLDRFFSLHPENARAITIEEVEEIEEGIFRVIGNCGNTQWTLPGLIFPLQNIHVILTFNPTTNEADIDFVLIRGEIWVNEKSYYLIGYEAPEGEFIFTSHQEQDFHDASLALGASFIEENILLQNFINTVAEGTNNAYNISLIDNESGLLSVQKLNVGFDISGIPFVKDHLQDVNLTLLKQEWNNPDQTVYAQLNWIAEGDILLDQAYKVIIEPQVQSSVKITIAAEENAFPSPAVLSNYLGLTQLSEALDQLLEPISFLDFIELNRIELLVNVDELSFISAQVFGKVQLDTYQFNFSIAFPHLIFETALSPETPILVSNIVRHFSSEGLNVPGNMKISEVALGVVGNPLTVRTKLALADVWNFHIGTMPLSLTKVELGIQKKKGSEISAQIGAKLFLGAIDFQLAAIHNANENGWLFTTEIAHEAEISLREIIAELGHLFHFDTPESIPDILLHNIELGFQTATHNFRFIASATLNEALGPIKKGSITVDFELEKDNETNRHNIKISLDGNLNIADTALNFKAKLGQSDWGFSIDWNKDKGEAIHLLNIAEHIIESLQNEDDAQKTEEAFNDVPQEVKDALSISQIHLEYQNETKTFNASLSTEGGESVVVAASKSEGKWGFLFGIGYQKPEDIPELGEHLKEVHKTIELENLWLLINTFEASVTPPALPEQFPHELKPNEMGKMLAVMATLNLDDNQEHKGLSELKQHLPNTQLSLMAVLFEKEGEPGIRLKAGLTGEVEIPTGQGHHLSLENCFIQFEWHGAHLRLKLEGTVHFTVDHIPISTTVGLDVSEHGADARVAVVFDEGWKLFGLDGIYLDELDLLLGVGFEPPGVEIGLQGKMHLKNQAKNANELGILLEFVGEIPNPEYFALNIHELDLSKIIAMCEGSSASGNQHIARRLRASNLSIYWAQRELTLPDGTTARPGFGLHGEFDIFGWKAYAHLDAHADSGISGHAETSPINWHILKLSGNGNGVYANEYWSAEDNTWLRYNNANTQIPTHARTRTVELVPPGGPMIHFDSNHSPFVSASVHVQLWELVSTELDIEVTNQGFHFNLHFEVPHITNLRLGCTLENNTFKANGDFFAGLDLVIETVFGDIDIELGVYATMHVNIGESLSDFILELEGGIDLMGAHIPFARVNLSHPPQRMEQVPLWLAMHFAESIFPPLHDLFQEAYDEMNKAPEEFDVQRYNNALKLLEQARAWAAFVHADIIEMRREGVLSYQAALKRAAEIEQQAKDIRTNGGLISDSIKNTGTAEKKRLSEEKKRVKSQATKQRKKGYDQRQIQIDRMLLEIKDILDSENKLQTAINAIWDKHQSDLQQTQESIIAAQNLAAVDRNLPARVVNEQHERLAQIQQQIDTAVEALKLQTAAGKKYPNTSMKFTPQAVDHHATIISGNRLSKIKEAAILREARIQARKIINRAHREVREFTNNN